VTRDKALATEKAKALISAAVNRGRLAEALQRRSMEVNADVLVIGGGIAGIEAALLAARAGRKVYLVEREISLGGTVIKTEQVAPNLECSPCLLAPRLALVKEHPNIRVITNAEVIQLLGFYGNFSAKIIKKARFVEDNCIGCEECFPPCPVTISSDFHLGLGKVKAIYTLFPGSVPAAAAIDRASCLHFSGESCVKCVEACPFKSINFEQRDELIEVNIGAVVVATGYADGDVSQFDRLDHGKIDNVYTLPEFERLASSNGPTRGVIQLRDGGKPSSVAVIHCAGSLTENGVPYCSGSCCTQAVKVGMLVRH
jgi:heterodisulfide reductase subunit A